ncbi:MAG: hypothetical protein WDA10_06320 [Porticoccaceae bacterium]|jgi:hypothetical protein|nr:hypothetical protein [Porticoccaceae bacterium]MEA3300656.1 hypothetical protein [Pseudomonadota bacterium]HLS97710.1 hypothetical protein [Porticoccaceae bacterium]
MKALKILCFMVLGAAVMLGSMLWVAQFFTGDGDVTPVIWLDAVPADGDAAP